MIDYEAALARVKQEYVSPEDLTYELLALEHYESSQAKLCYPYPRDNRIYDDDGLQTGKVDQKTVYMARFADPALVPGQVVVFHHGQVPGSSLVIFAHRQE